MAKVRTFSRVFPSYHPRKGQNTFFVEKILKGLDSPEDFYFDKLLRLDIVDFDDLDCLPKFHTIRAGKHFKEGDWFSPRVWIDKPRSSKQIIIAPDLQFKKIWDIWHDENGWRINGNSFYEIERLAQNDGLSVQDFLDWFNLHPKKKGETFTGQILCWNENINY